MKNPSSDGPSLSNIPEFSVSEVAQAIKRVVEGGFERIRVRGEISGLARPASGHMYFKLKDADSVLDGVCWKFSLPKLKIKPEEGMEVVATGKISTYPGGSRYQIVVDSIELAGAGALLKLLEERKKKLAAEGLFDAARKKPLPSLPRVIGVVTSPTGAVIRDILHRLNDRFPCHVLIWPVAVQGDGAAAQIASAIVGFDQLLPTKNIPKPDLLIVARGGGSIEDLWEFNDEAVVRAAASCSIPLISAVGHEVDYTLLDFAADQRAPTPTAAAEMAVPVQSQWIAAIADKASRLHQAIVQKLQWHQKNVEGLARGLTHPRQTIASLGQKLDDKSSRLDQAAQKFILTRRNRLQKLHLQPGILAKDILHRKRIVDLWVKRLDNAASVILRRKSDALSGANRLLQNLSYRRVLERGFSLVFNASGAAVTRMSDVAIDQNYKLQLSDGHAMIVVRDKKPD